MVIKKLNTGYRVESEGRIIYCEPSELFEVLRNSRVRQRALEAKNNYCDLANSIITANKKLLKKNREAIASLNLQNYLN